MLVLTCIACLGYQAQKIHLSQTLLNETLPKACFANKLAERGVGDYWINQIQGMGYRLQISFYNDPTSKVVGWTYAHDTHIRLNRAHHDKYTACKSASNIAHEYVHTLGYKHFVDVAYATNYAFSACCRE